MKTHNELNAIVASITYKPGWEIIFSSDSDGRPFIQIAASTLDSISNEMTAWKSGKSYLSPHMCTQEVVGAVFGQIRAAEEHEMKEFFRYKGASIFNPHLDPDVLAEVAKKKSSFNLRDNPMSMIEA
jgi:hypothetical protein